MSCVLRAIGTLFDVDAFLADSALGAEARFRHGEPHASGLAGGARHAASGFNVVISEASVDDLPGQIRDALRFLTEQEDELRRLGSFPGLEEVCLDFAARRREGPMQSDLFPAELLWRAGALDIDLMITHYAFAEGAS